ncbi:MAG: histidinol dehydrogenase, partial [Acidimicrobiales bacterium]
MTAVVAIVAEVAARGDAAVREYTARFDRAEVDELRVPATELAAALGGIPVALRQALEASRDAIEAHHRHQVTQVAPTERDGLRVATIRRPVDRAGLYVPGGRACYPSTVLMTAVPARVAGVGELALCVPPGRDGRVATPTLAAAALAGVDEVYRVGGAQAVAAMAYGTESVAPVDVIAGPGNRYVAIAERLVAQEGAVGVPSAFTGPSEVVVVADETTPVDYAAIDLVVQAEHGPDGLAWLVTWSEEAAEQISEAVGALAGASPRRDEILSTLAAGGYAVLVDGREQAMAVANVVAAEHLELMTADAAALVPLVRNAGAVFVGPWSPASVG